MSNLVLTRKAGQSVRLMIGGESAYLEVESVTGGNCRVEIRRALRRWSETIRFRGEMQIAEGVTVTVLDLAKGHAKLHRAAPRRAMFTSCVLN